MPYKRRSRGRSKGGKGRSGFVHCANCGQLIPKDKAKKITRRFSLVDPVLAKELRQKGTFISALIDVKYYCVSCAVHYGIVKVRAKEERHIRARIGF